MIEARRARALLGTRVEVGAWGEEREALLAAAGAALDEVARIHRLLSFHDPASELSRLHRQAGREPTPVDRRTLAVLRLALRLHHTSGGAFDPAVAPRLVEAGLLPAPSDSPRPAAGASLADLEITGGRVRLRRPLWLDLGGLAKGYAVDRAIAVLRRAGARRGWVDAGGDLRVFGDQAMRVGVRPRDAAEVEAVVELRGMAIATSSGWTTSTRSSGACHLLDPASGRFVSPRRAATVVAPRCAIADGLTKVMLAATEGTAALLRRWGARGILFEPDGRRLLPGGFLPLDRGAA